MGRAANYGVGHLHPGVTLERCVRGSVGQARSLPDPREDHGIARNNMKSSLIMLSVILQDNRGAKPKEKVNSTGIISLPLTGTVGEEETNCPMNSMDLLSFADQEIEEARSIPYLKPIYPMASPPQMTRTAETISMMKFRFDLQAVRQLTRVAE